VRSDIVEVVTVEEFMLRENGQFNPAARVWLAKEKLNRRRVFGNSK
jgi:hypothetical protein